MVPRRARRRSALPDPRLARRGGRAGASGGEETPANALWALLAAVKKAGSTDRAAMVRALEGLATRFAGLPFGFTPKRTSADPRRRVPDHARALHGPGRRRIRRTSLGREWERPSREIRPDYVGPAHLVRPTLAANRRAQPEYMRQILDEGWGTQCTKTPARRRGVDVEMTDECKIH